MNENYGTLSETLNGLKKEGYTLDFNISGECIICNETNTTLSPDEFQIEKVYRFEGASDPDDESIVCYFFNKWIRQGNVRKRDGIYPNEASSALVEKLKTHHLTRSQLSQEGKTSF